MSCPAKAEKHRMQVAVLAQGFHESFSPECPGQTPPGANFAMEPSNILEHE